MVEKALVTGGIRFGTLRTVDQVTESLSGDLGREIPEEDAALDDDRNRRQCHADGGDADGSIRVGLISDQPIVRVGFVQIVQDRGELQQAEISVGQQSMWDRGSWEVSTIDRLLSFSPIARGRCGFFRRR